MQRTWLLWFVQVKHIHSQGRHSPMGLKCNPIHHGWVANFDNKTGLASKTKIQQKKVELVSLKMSKERN